MNIEGISILFPPIEGVKYKELSETTCHDLGLDAICQKLTPKENEQRMILSVISKMTGNAEVAKFRQEVFADILKMPKMRNRMMELLDQVRFLKDYGSFKRDYDKKASLWDLLHRLEEINDYIKCVEAIRECLSAEEIHSDGLKELHRYVEKIYEDALFAQMKKDIEGLKATTSDIRSVTVGINVNERFEAGSIGLISVNNKPFKNSNIVSNFAQALAVKDGLHEGTEWNGDMHFHPIEKEGIIPFEKLEKQAGFAAMQSTPFMDNRVRASIVNIPENEGTEESTHYMSKVVDQMLSLTVRKLREVLSKYVTVTITRMTDLIPEFMYYIKFAEYIEKMSGQGFLVSKANVLENEIGEILTEKESNASLLSMQAKEIYNLKLTFAGETEAKSIVYNDLDFSREHLVYILTGANRGGKTTITQAIGQLFVLAQGGIFVPGKEFSYVPVDCIYTHFPADEDKTMDLGRLGEECTRFKDMYENCTKESLLLLNETFSTTSFEEGYYIAKDSIKAILQKGVRTIYNTHMHKLAFELDEVNAQSEKGKAASLVVKTDGKNRSFKIELAPPEGMSYARDIAVKYGVTYEMLTGK